MYHGNDSLIELKGLKNKKTGTFINNGTVTVTLKTLEGVVLTGVTWPVTLNPTGSGGNYDVNVGEAVDTESHTSGIAEINVSGGGLTAKFECPVEFKTRRCC